MVNDCCGYCPVPKTDEEKEVAEEEAKVYVSGKISFLKDDPGRQVRDLDPPLTLSAFVVITPNILPSKSARSTP